jgi:transposase
MDTMEHATRRRVREHPAALRQQVLSECEQPGASVARVALRHGLNANMVHAWRKLAREQQGQPSSAATATASEFIALPLLPSTPTTPLPDIRIELRRGATSVSIAWPSQAAADCAAWLRDWLR